MSLGVDLPDETEEASDALPLSTVLLLWCFQSEVEAEVALCFLKSWFWTSDLEGWIRESASEGAGVAEALLNHGK